MKKHQKESKFYCLIKHNPYFFAISYGFGWAVIVFFINYYNFIGAAISFLVLGIWTYWHMDWKKIKEHMVW